MGCPYVNRQFYLTNNISVRSHHVTELEPKQGIILYYDQNLYKYHQHLILMIIYHVLHVLYKCLYIMCCTCLKASFAQNVISC